MNPRLFTLATLLILSLFALHSSASARPIIKLRDDAPDVMTAAATAAEYNYCPKVSFPDPAHPQAPAGFSWYVQPELGGYSDFFLIDVLHSLNTDWIYKQVICKYAACERYGCPTIVLVTDAQYENPTKPSSEGGQQWSPYGRINDTLICAPQDTEAKHCPYW